MGKYHLDVMTVRGQGLLQCYITPSQSLILCVHNIHGIFVQVRYLTDDIAIRAIKIMKITKP